MRRALPLPAVPLLAATLVLAACGGGGERPGAAPTGPQAIVTVLYNWPTDTAAFEAYYPTHLKLVEDGLREIGFSKAELTRFVSSLDGQKPAFYRQAELYFPDMDAARRGMATAAFQTLGDDFANFATGGLVALLATEAGPASDTDCPALVTVIYETPADRAAFEAYYPRHLDLVTQGQAEIGFVRADLTRFVSAPDGSAAAKYRQAELCFPSLEALRAGLGTAAFKRVGDDLANFATGGFTALIGVTTN